MDRYSKINSLMGHSQNSRSMDLSSDLQYPISPETNLQMQQNTKNPQQDNKAAEIEAPEAAGVLKRTSSLSSSSSSGAFQSAVRGAFSSMRRSSSVSERYSRIHDQSATSPLPTEDGDEDHHQGWGATRSAKKKQRGGKIFRACKRLFGM